MTIHRITSNIVLFALGLNIALASASAPTSQFTDDCGSAKGCVHPALTVKAIKISRPVRSREDVGNDQIAAIEIAYG